MPSPFRDDAFSALEKVARLEAENAELRARLRRERLWPGAVVAAALVFLAAGSGWALLTAHRMEKEPIAVLRTPELTVASFETAVVTSTAPRGGMVEPLEELPFRDRCPFGEKEATLKVAVKDGRAVGVSVYTNPRDPMLAFCIEAEAEKLRWPATPALSTFRRSLP